MNPHTEVGCWCPLGTHGVRVIAPRREFRMVATPKLGRSAARAQSAFTTLRAEAMAHWAATQKTEGEK